MSGATITASTSVILIDTATNQAPYIVYFPYNANIGRIITVRDNDGYASTGNTIVLSTLSGAYFPNKQSIITINQPYGFITFSVQADGYYSILNTFAFPTGSDSAYVYNLNTNILGIQDKTTNIFNTITTSTGTLYFNSIQVGDVTSLQLSNVLAKQYITKEYVAVGINTLSTATISTATIQFSDNTGIYWYDAPITTGFTNGGTDIASDIYGYYIACGNNTQGSPLGFIQWSFDGKTWINSTSPPLDSTTLRKRVHYANGLWHAIGAGSNGQSILWSSDRVNWNSSISLNVTSSSNVFNGIAYGNGLWVCCGSNSNANTSLLRSSDGSNWTATGTIPNFSSVFYDIIYDGKKFITLLSNGTTANIYTSQNGINWTVISLNFNNQSGYLAGNYSINLAVNDTKHKFSVNNGTTWNDIVDFPSGIPSRPYYDGSVWWVGIDGVPNAYVSATGSNNWFASSIVGLFPEGYPIAFTSFNTSANLNFQLISSIYGIEQGFYIKELKSDILKLNTFSIENSNSNVLNIKSDNTNAVVFINTLSTSHIETQTINLEVLTINNLNINTIRSETSISTDIYSSTINGGLSYLSNIYASTVYITDILNSSTIVANTMDSLLVNISSLNIYSELIANTINVTKLDGLMANISTLNVTDVSYAMLACADVISTGTLVTSSIQLLDTSGSQNNLYSSTNILYFQGIPITTKNISPTYFAYNLLDTTGSPPGGVGQFSINTTASENLINVNQILLYSTDLNNRILSGFYNKVGINCIIHIINIDINSDHIYVINSIIADNSATFYTLNVTFISGSTEIAVLNKTYNIFIESIGIPPPILPPSNLITLNAPISSVGFDLRNSSVLVNIPTYIGTYNQGSSDGTAFSISLNSQSYSIANIPALIGSIVYYTPSGYIVANVKFGSSSRLNGAYITIDSGIQTLSVSGLSINNFTGVYNDTNGFAIYITIQLLN